MIPCLYTFRYDGEKREKAIRRLQCSIKSIEKQAKIFILDASTEPLILPDVEILHKPQSGPFIKGKLINHAVKYYLSGNEYIILADADIVFPPDYVERMLAYTHGPEPVRVVGHNQGAAHEFYTSDIDEGIKLIQEHGIMSYRCGFSPGIGLLHIPSFIKIRGVNEDYIEYGPEDQELNRRLAYINKYIYDKSIINIHLFHEDNGKNFVNQNNEIYIESERQFQAGDLVRNSPESWGEY